MATPALLTADEFEVMPGCKRCELIRGEIRERPYLGGLGGRVNAQLTAEIGRFNNQDQLGAAYCGASYVLSRDPDTVLGPHISFVRAGQPPKDDRDGFLRRIPDLAIEIVAPDEGFSELFEKVAILHHAGVPLVWVVDTFCKMVFVWHANGTAQTLTQSDTLGGEEVLPGFHLPLADIFR
ncbi:MAG: Uma2 family endonuclease [Chloroflexia bacterium]|nr:Uma2 family endonuclease [Chloroflexia bacterium]